MNQEEAQQYRDETIPMKLPKTKKSESDWTATAPQIMEAAANTFRAKHKEYGGNDMIFAATMMALFPDGLTIKTFDDWYRIHIFILDMVKTTRYATNFVKGGHADSIHDKIVYCAMLESYDALMKEEKENGKG